MATTQEVRFRYTADDRQFRTTSGRVQTSLGKLTRTAGAFTLGSLGATSLLASFGTVRNQIAKTIDAFKEQELASASLNAALAATGKGGTEAFKTLADEAKRLQTVTTAGDEALLRATATLAQLVPSLDVAGLRDAQTAIVGFADTFVGGDLNNAALLLGKTLGSTTNALTRYGISITDTAAPATEKLAELMGNQTLAAAFEVSQAKAKTLQGRMEQLGNASGDLREVLGEIVVEAADFGTAAGDLTTTLTELSAAIEGNQGKWVLWLQIVGGALKGILLGLAAFPRIIFNIGQQIDDLAAAAGALNRLDFAGARAAFKAFRDDTLDIGKSVTDAVDAFLAVGDAVTELNRLSQKHSATLGLTVAQYKALRGEVDGLGGDGADDTPLEGLDKVLARLATSLSVARGEFQLFGDESKRVAAEMSAVRAAITALLSAGVDPSGTLITNLLAQLESISFGKTSLATLRPQLVALGDELRAAGVSGQSFFDAFESLVPTAEAAAVAIEEAAEAISDWQHATNAIVDRATFILVDAAKDWKEAFKSFADFALSELARVLTKLALFRFLRFAFAGSTGGIGGAILEAVGGNTGALAPATGGVTLDFSKAPPATNPIASQRDTEIQKWVVGVIKNASAQGIR